MPTRPSELVINYFLVHKMLHKSLFKSVLIDPNLIINYGFMPLDGQIPSQHVFKTIRRPSGKQEHAKSNKTHLTELKFKIACVKCHKVNIFLHLYFFNHIQNFQNYMCKVIIKMYKVNSKNRFYGPRAIFTMTEMAVSKNK